MNHPEVDFTSSVTVKHIFDKYSPNKDANKITVKRLLNLMNLNMDKVQLEDRYSYEQFKQLIIDLTVKENGIKDTIKRSELECDIAKIPDTHDSTKESMNWLLDALFEDTPKNNKLAIELLERRLESIDMFTV